jgi:hypothetical protein
VQTVTSRHSWGEPQRFAHKTERECLNGCGIVKVTRHEGDQHWVEFWRDLGRVDVGGKTPVYERAMADA